MTSKEPELLEALVYSKIGIRIVTTQKQFEVEVLSVEIGKHQQQDLQRDR